ncbi:MAG TPA: glycosyltransferase [Pyrinomonadaceae bacterium]
MHETAGWTISVVVPVYNAETTISATIEHLLRQSLTPDEIIVVDDGSTDETANLLKAFAGQITVLSKTNGGPASARNAGIQASSSSLIAFTDSDCLPDEEWLQELVKGFKSDLVSGVGGSVEAATDGLVGEYIDLHGWMNPQQEASGIVTSLVTANACFRSDVLQQTNLFDERFPGPGAEDTELSIRVRSAGYELSFVKTALVRHLHKKTVWSYCKNMANHGEGRAVLEQLWPQEQTSVNRSQELMRSAFGLRTMFRFYSSYRQHLDRRRSVLFSFLDHCQYLARIWGYRRGKRRRLKTFKSIPLSADHSNIRLSKKMVDSENRV